MVEAVHHYEGTVNQVMGDGIMALFGAPLAHEDHAVCACCAALRMREAIRRYAEDVGHAHGVEAQIRVGLNSGEVVATRTTPMRGSRWGERVGVLDPADRRRRTLAAVKAVPLRESQVQPLLVVSEEGGK
jgi:class 3 adenylate cyclase